MALRAILQFTEWAVQARMVFRPNRIHYIFYILHKVTFNFYVFLSMCLLKLSTGLFRRSEEKENSCELRYYFVNYVTILFSSKLNIGTVVYFFIAFDFCRQLHRKLYMKHPKTHFLTYTHAKHFKH